MITHANNLTAGPANDKEGWVTEESGFGSWRIYLYDEDRTIGNVPRNMTEEAISLIVHFYRQGVMLGECCGRLKAQAEMRRALGVVP